MSRLDAKLKNLSASERQYLIKKHITEPHILLCVTSLVTEMSDLWSERDWYNDLFLQKDLQNEGDDEDDVDAEFRQPLQFYIVTNWLSNKLMAHGALVTNIDGIKVWGRETYGQAPCLDSIIEDIFVDCIPDSWWGFDLSQNQAELVSKVKKLGFDDQVEFLLYLKTNQETLFQSLKSEFLNGVTGYLKIAFDLIYSDAPVTDLKVIFKKL